MCCHNLSIPKTVKLLKDSVSDCPLSCGILLTNFTRSSRRAKDGPRTRKGRGMHLRYSCTVSVSQWTTASKGRNADSLIRLTRQFLQLCVVGGETCSTGLGSFRWLTQEQVKFLFWASHFCFFNKRENIFIFSKASLLGFPD